MHDHDRGLAFDLSTMVERRGALKLLAGAGLVAIAGCASSGSSSKAASSTSSSSTTSTTASSGASAAVTGTVDDGLTIKLSMAA